jgi:O-antigen/teichoic acid export membrane protein
MRKFLIPLLITLLVSCAGQPPYYHIDDPFSEQLDTYFNTQRSFKNKLIFSSLIFAGGLIGGTIFTTYRSYNGDSTLNSIGIYTTYGLTAVSAAYSGYCFFKWSKNMDLYLETLRLQTQYYNIIQP